MNFHLAAFESAKTDSTANENISAVADAAFARSIGNLYLAPDDMDVLAAFAMNDTITRARIVSPSLRQNGLPEIFPLTVAATVTLEGGYAKYGNYGPRIRKNDEFGIEASNGASTVDTAFGALWLWRKKMGVPAGARFTVRGTSAITLVANAWVLGNLTFDQTLPVGDYAVIGMRATCTNGVFSRLVFPMNTTWRPGVVCPPVVTTFDTDPFWRFGNLGEWGRFHSVNQPQVEVLGHTAGAQTAAVILDCVALNQNAV